MIRAKKYLEVVIIQSITSCTSSNDTTTFGPELTFLLQYLNPKTYSTKHVVDPYHVIDIPDKILSSCAQSILKTTLCQFNLRDALILCVQQIVKLEDRSFDAARVKTMKLWLTTMTRLTLYPIEHADLSSDALDMATASKFLWTNTMAVPYLTSLINPMMVDRLRQWALNAFHLKQIESMESELSGNGFLFLLGNLIDLWNNEKNALKSEEEMRLVGYTSSLMNCIEPYFSDRQAPSFLHYHPVFKWSKASWGNSLLSIVFDKVMKQMEYVWSRSFMDQVFQNIIQFEHQRSKKILFKKQQQQQGGGGGDIAMFSMEVESIFSMYIQMTRLFKAHRKVIFYRIAFTSQLMTQLWKLMNQFGPKGNMTIYLEAAKRKDIDKEPLVQILRVFCEACSIVFL
jgi:ubiquitin-protein ligase E3 B